MSLKIKRAAFAVLGPIGAHLLGAGPVPDPPAAPTIVRIMVPPESEQSRPIVIPTEPENSVEIEFPSAVSDWAGRGFTPDPDTYAGDFVVDAKRGTRRMFVTPITSDAHRVLHVILAPDGMPERSVPIEFVPGPPNLAWRKVILVSQAFGQEPPAPAPKIPSLEMTPSPYPSRYREPTAETEIGLVRILRMLMNMPAPMAKKFVAANQSLRMADQNRPPEDFGEFTLRVRFALRDEVTDCLGLCVEVSNESNRRLLLDERGWTLRAGERVYPVQTVDCPALIEPEAASIALLVLGRGPDGQPTGLLASNDFGVTARVQASTPSRLVQRFKLEDPP